MIEKRKLSTVMAILAVVALGGFAAGCGSDSVSDLTEAGKNANKAVKEARNQMDKHGDEIQKNLKEAKKQLDENGDEIQKSLDKAVDSGDAPEELQKALEEAQRKIEEAQK